LPEKQWDRAFQPLSDGSKLAYFDATGALLWNTPEIVKNAFFSTSKFTFHIIYDFNS
jgi:hypothetical protein